MHHARKVNASLWSTSIMLNSSLWGTKEVPDPFGSVFKCIERAMYI